MMDELVALLDGREVGRIHKGAGNRLTFAYAEAWRQSPDAYPLSLSMPPAAREHGRAVVESFLWGLLPDNEQVLGRWAARFQISARNVFALIANVGEDCAGAVQFVAPDRLDALCEGKGDGIEWLDDADIARRLKTLRDDHAAWRLPRDTGQFSLAGAQPKTALLRQDGRWGIPSGRVPTTHILKPPTGEFDGHAENEHICLALARRLGLPAAHTSVERFEGEVAIVIERYDRQRHDDRILRVHQEDACQALGIMPTKKYQNEGGPGPVALVDLLRTYSTDRAADVDTFVAALGLNWLIAGTDAHAKNFSLLLGGGRVRLAPLYDIASILPYDGFDRHKAKLAMKIGDEYKLDDIGIRQWQKFARAARVDADALVLRLRDMAEKVPDEVRAACVQARDSGLDHAIVDRLAERVIDHVGRCRRLLGSA